MGYYDDWVDPNGTFKGGRGRSPRRSKVGWASSYIERLKAGETVSFRPTGGSMKGKIESGELVTVKPLGDHVVQVGDIVLCKVKKSEYLHLVKDITEPKAVEAFNPHGPELPFPKRYQIGNNKGGINGWIGRNNIYGLLTK
jgi:hypothetical protein